MSTEFNAFPIPARNIVDHVAEAEAAAEAAEDAKDAAEAAASQAQAIAGLEGGVTTSPTDTTPGRITKVGDFGLGQTASVPTMPDLNDIGFPSGIFRYEFSALNRPDNDGAGIVLNGSFGSTSKTQLAVRHFSGLSRGTIYSRAYQNDEWTPWRRSYDTLNILGTVSQSSGVPTGAIIQRGSNSNGEFVRFADGTQICTRLVSRTNEPITAGVAGIHVSARHDYTFPASFVAEPTVSLVSNRVSSVGTFALEDGKTTSQWQLRWGRVTPATQNVEADLTAIGRWF